MLNIKPTDRVLEIGSGNRPRKRSDVLCDKFIADNTQRSGGEDIIIDKRPFVVADGLALPFKDNSFDYVITSHILEHIDDPHKFASELTRVAKRGYIETPSELGEKIFGWSFHRWIVRFENDTIIMRPRLVDSPFADYFHKMYERDLRFAEFVDSHFADFYVQLEWAKRISLRIEEDTSPHVHFSNNMLIVPTHSAFKERAVAFLHPISNFLLKTIRHFRKFE
jgi:SAM-dependent methyltransferase